LIGLVTAYSADMRNQHASIAVLFSPEYAGSGWVVESLVLFIDYLFDVFPLRKLYFETLEFVYPSFASGEDRFFTIEGRLEAHEFHRGRYWDKLIGAIYRDGWPEASARFRS
jgi:RimJ/RimL family protein N-acetyltransferase